MDAPLLALDAPRTLSRRVWIRRGLILVITALVVAAAAWRADIIWPAIPAVGLLQAVVGSLVSAITSMLMFEHARATGRRGFVAIAVTYLYLACILAVFTLAFPGAFAERKAIIGSTQTPVALFVAWHFAVPVGLSVAAILLYRDEARHRRPILSTAHIRISAALGILGVLVAVVLALKWQAWGLPDLLTPDSHLTELSRLLLTVCLLLSLAFLAIAAYCARNGSIILGWLGATAVLTAGEAVISFFSVQRYSVGWYTSRVLWLVAVSVLLIALIRSLSRVAEANIALGNR